jgi:hypothetical protein
VAPLDPAQAFWGGFAGSRRWVRASHGGLGSSIIRRLFGLRPLAVVC